MVKMGIIHGSLRGCDNDKVRRKHQALGHTTGLPSSRLHSSPATSGPSGHRVTKVLGSGVPGARRPLLLPRPGPWHPRWSSWVTARGCGAAPQQNPLGGTLLRGEGDAASARARETRGPSGNLRGGSALPRAPLAPAGSGHRPLRRGSLRAKGIFLWILLEASAAARRASPHPPESWRPRSPQRGAPRPGTRTTAPAR